MVIRLILLSTLSLGSVSNQAAELTLQFDRETNTVEMGKFLLARIIYRGNADPGPTDLTPWQDTVHAERRDREVSKEGQETIATELLRLYPKHLGEQTFPALASGGTVLRPQAFKVLPAVRNGIDGTPRWSPIPERLWRGETIDLSVAIDLYHPSNTVSASHWESPAFHITPLPQRREEKTEGVTMHMSWRITPKHKGIHTIELPGIEQRGRGRYRFHLPARNLEVRPIPSYLPATLPIGKPELSSKLVESDNQAYWELSITKEGKLPAEIMGIRRQLIDRAANETDEVKLESSSESGLSARTYTVPIDGWQWGTFLQQSIEVEYFDPSTGALTSKPVALPTLWQLPIWFVTAVCIGLAVLLFFAARSTSGMLKASKELRTYRHAKDRCRTPHELRRTTLAFNNKKVLRDVYTDRELVSVFNEACFSLSRSTDIDKLKQQTWVK